MKMKTNIVNSIKFYLGYIRCKRNHIAHQKHVYIGKSANIVGGVSIRLSPYVIIRPYVDIWATGGFIKIGEGTEIGERCRISISNELIIGNHVLFSPNVYITDCDHEYKHVGIPIIKQGIVHKDNRVEIGDGSYIGINSVIVGNVKIGAGSVIGANSVVTKDIPDCCIAVGVPARVIKRFNSHSQQWERVE